MEHPYDLNKDPSENKSFMEEINSKIVNAVQEKFKIMLNFGDYGNSTEEKPIEDTSESSMSEKYKSSVKSKLGKNEL